MEIVAEQRRKRTQLLECEGESQVININIADGDKKSSEILESEAAMMDQMKRVRGVEAEANFPKAEESAMAKHIKSLIQVREFVTSPNIGQMFGEVHLHSLIASSFMTKGFYRSPVDLYCGNGCGCCPKCGCRATCTPGFWFVLSPGPTTASSLYLAKWMKWASLEEKAKIEHVEVCPSALKLIAEIA
ncbi:unnamed protein product [Sphagnum troendelagicum]